MRHSTSYLLLATILLVSASVSASPLGIYEGAIKTQADVQHYWPLDDNTAPDGVGSLIGTPNNTTAVADLLGRAGKAMNFHTTTSHVTFPSNGLTIGGSGALEAWIKFDETGSPIASKYVIRGGNSDLDFVALRNRSGGNRVWAGLGNRIDAADIRSTINQWRYYAITWEPNSGDPSKHDLKTYYSGADGFSLYDGFSGTAIGGTLPSSAPLIFGAYLDTHTASHYKGSLDNVAMYTDVLSKQSMKNHIRMASFAADPFLGRYQQTVLDTPGLIHYWPLDNLATEDVVGQIDAGEPTPGRVLRTTNVLGQTDAAIDFVPEARIAFAENLTLGNEGTMEFWMRPDGISTQYGYAISARETSSSSDRLYVKTQRVGGNDRLEFGFASDYAADLIDITGRVGTGEWMMGAMTWTYDAGPDEFTLTTYLSDTDGVMQANAPVTISGGSAPDNALLILGRYSWDTGSYYDGGLDELAFYDRALSAAELQGHYGTMIPEPSTLLLLSLGGAALMFIRRRRR